MTALTPERAAIREQIRMLTKVERQQLRNLTNETRGVYWSSRGHIHRKLRAAGLVQRMLLGDPSGGGFARLTPRGKDVVRELERTGA